LALENPNDLFNAGVRISLDMGMQLNIEIEGVSMPLHSEFVGMENSQYIIIKIPQPYSSIKHKLFKGNQIIAKYLTQGTVYAFQTKILEIIAKPVRLLFLEYPKIIQHRDLRSHKRISCFIPVNIEYGDKELSGAMLDINKGGCRCQINKSTKDELSSLKVKDSILLKFPFPGVEGNIEISGEISNIKKNKTDLHTGVMFRDTSEEVKQTIERYIVSVYDFI